MNRRQALEDLFLAVRNDLLNKGVSKKPHLKLPKQYGQKLQITKN